MKSSFFLVALFGAILMVSACKGKETATTTDNTTTTTATQPAATPQPAINATTDGSINITPTTAPQAEPAQNAKGVWHFTCPKGCPGGAGSQGTCPKCQTALVHNTAYHQQ